jgi:hypothetical protein
VAADFLTATSPKRLLRRTMKADADAGNALERFAVRSGATAF